MNFWGSSEGGEGGVIFNPEIYIADFGNFKQGFLSMKLIQKSNFRVQGMFFSIIVLRKIKSLMTVLVRFQLIFLNNRSKVCCISRSFAKQAFSKNRFVSIVNIF